MYGTSPLASRPFASAPRPTRPYKLAAVSGEFGWAAWSFSRQAKLNAWAWHGLGGDNVLAWAVLGNYTYFRRENTGVVHQMLADSYLAAGEASTDSTSVLATTQWLDFNKVGKLKALTGIDADCEGITAIEIYIAIDGNRDGVLAETIPIGDNSGGWTYNGEIIPLSLAATEFKIRFIGDGNQEVQINRVTLHWTPIDG